MKIVIEFILAFIILHPLLADDIPIGTPRATIDLTTDEGVRIVGGHWKYSDTRIIETDFRSSGADNQPTGTSVKTYDYTPQAGISGFDDTDWEVVAARDLSKRRGNGRLSFNWYRINVTVPETANGISTEASTLVFQTVLDDYAEVWVNGEIPRYLGRTGGSVISGWNAPNRLVVGRNVKTGQSIQLAIFGINGPISNPPPNYIWIREAKLEFYNASAEPVAISPSEVNVEIKRDNPAIDRIISFNPKLFKLAEGFKFTEGPVWIGDGLLFSDPNSNTIYKYS